MALDFRAMMEHERRKQREERAKAARDAAARDAAAETEEEPKHLHSLEAAGISGIQYCDAFLDDEESTALVDAIRSGHRNHEWLGLTKRKLLNLGGVPHPEGMIAEELPQWLNILVMRRLEALGIFSQDNPPNQVLLNEYAGGKGINPHNDGPLYEPIAVIISLASRALLHFLKLPSDFDSRTGSAGKRDWKDLDDPVANVILNPGSLLVFTGNAYSNFLHGIRDTMEEVVDSCTLNRDLVAAEIGQRIARSDHRISLTIRAVRRISVPAGEYLQAHQAEEAQRRRMWWAQAVSEKQ